MSHVQRVIGAYLSAKDRVIADGFEHEIRWQESRDIRSLNESEFLAETAWVIIASGLSDHVVRSVFPEISRAFAKWRSAAAIVRRGEVCRLEALTVFGHVRKVNSIVEIAHAVWAVGFEQVHAEIIEGGPRYLDEIPYVGPVTALHLAKNLGIPTAKPDRHLTRIAAAFRYETADELCHEVATRLGENPSVVDLVFWRHATRHPDYLQVLLDDYWAAAE